RRHTRFSRDWSSDVCSSDLLGRRGDPYAGDRLSTIGPSPVRETLHRSIPKEMDDHDINRVVKAYAQAALRCKEGGLDGIETLAEIGRASCRDRLEITITS